MTSTGPDHDRPVSELSEKRRGDGASGQGPGKRREDSEVDLSLVRQLGLRLVLRLSRQ